MDHHWCRHHLHLSCTIIFMDTGWCSRRIVFIYCIPFLCRVLAARDLLLTQYFCTVDCFDLQSSHFLTTNEAQIFSKKIFRNNLYFYPFQPALLSSFQPHGAIIILYCHWLSSVKCLTKGGGAPRRLRGTNFVQVAFDSLNWAISLIFFLFASLCIELHWALNPDLLMTSKWPHNDLNSIFIDLRP